MGRKFHPDRGWAWVVLAASFLIDFHVDGTLYSIGVYYVEWLDEFNEGRGVTSWVAAAQISFMQLVGFGSSIFANRYGGRLTVIVGSSIAFVGTILSVLSPNIATLMVTIGIIQGFGIGMQSFVLYVMIGKYFKRHLSLATGIAASGTGIGLLVFPVLSKFLINVYNWRGALLILAGINLHTFLYAFAYRPIPEEYTKEGNFKIESEIKPKLLDTSLLKKTSMICVFLSGFFCTIGMHIPFVFIVDLCRQVGYEKESGVLITTLIGLSNIFLRPAIGCLADRTHPIKIYITLMLLGGAATGVLGFMTSFYGLIACSLLFAVSLATHVALIPPIIVRLVGVQGMSNAYGFFKFIRGCTALLATPLAGFLYDWTNSYAITFIVAGSGLCLSGVVCVPILNLQKYSFTNQSRSPEPVNQSPDPGNQITEAKNTEPVNQSGGKPIDETLEPFNITNL